MSADPPAAAAVDPRTEVQLISLDSADLLRLPATGDSLAGRAESLELFGLSQGERAGYVEQFIDEALGGNLFLDVPGVLDRAGYLSLACEGGYPEALDRPSERRRHAWFDNYTARIVTRDAADISRLSHLADLPRLMRLLAAHTASTVTTATLARNVNLPESTLPPYLDLLETLFLLQRVPAWSNNLAGRVTKAPKLALLDSGLTARLLNTTSNSLASGVNPDPAGRLLETFTLSELRKQLPNTEAQPTLMHWRDRKGPEVDVVLEAADGRVVAIEVTSSATLGNNDFRWLTLLRQTLRTRFVGGFVIYTGRDPLPWGDRLAGIPMSTLWTSSAEHRPSSQWTASP